MRSKEDKDKNGGGKYIKRYDEREKRISLPAL